MAEIKKTQKASKPAVTKKVKQTATEEISSLDMVENDKLQPVIETADVESKPVAKAGKRSAKAVKESEDKAAKEARKADTTQITDEESPKKPVKPARSKLERRSKSYRKAYELTDKDKVYDLAEALQLIPKTSTVKFDAAVELHVNLNVDPRQADQNIRGTVVLPAGTGKSVRIAVFADEDDAKKAKAAGADTAAGDDFLKQLDKGVLDFDVLIATPGQMAKLGKYARLLGPKGLMPNPKSGTVTTDVSKAVKEAKAGRVEFRVDSNGIIHVAIGKVSFETTKLQQNSEAIISSLKAAKPASVKGIYIKSAYLTTSMGPSIKISI